MLGEQGQAVFTILNKGALQVQFDISSGGQVSVHSYNAAGYSATAFLQTYSLQGCFHRATACNGVSAKLLPAMVSLQRYILQRLFCRAVAFKGVPVELQPLILHDSLCRGGAFC